MKAALVVLCILLVCSSSGCSIRKMAINSIGDSLVKGASVYETDDDPELVRDALPFGLKMTEMMLAEAPENRGLLVAAASGFTQYAAAFVEMDAMEAEDDDPVLAREHRERAKRLYLRSRDYGLRALSLVVPGFRDALESDPASALTPLERENVPELFWTAAAWVSAINAGKNDLDLAADLPLIEPMIDRCFELDPDFNNGMLHEFMIRFKGGLSAAQGGSIEEAREHFRRATELSGGRKISPLVALAETVCIATQDAAEFRRLLETALAFDVDSVPGYRLANLLAQKRARLLIDRIDDYFLEP